jgi:hypothetical protein
MLDLKTHYDENSVKYREPSPLKEPQQYLKLQVEWRRYHLCVIEFVCRIYAYPHYHLCVIEWKQWKIES